MSDSLRHSPLDADHRALGARMVPFGGWDMPLSYEAGTLHEHRTCRSSAVVFDVSHLGTLRVEGSAAFDRLQAAFTNDLRRIEVGRAQYTHLLDDDGSVLDDIIVWWVEAERFDVMPNASNTRRVAEALGADPDCRSDDVTSSRAVLAVQGPQARARLGTLCAAAAAVPRFGVATVTWEPGLDVVVAGTGYTGEDGVEIAVPAAAAPSVWRALLGVGIEPAGLGARDTLRLEAGLPLHGHELGPGITPLQAGLAWVVRWDKGDFRGRAALEAERAAGPQRLLHGLLLEGRRPARAGCEVRVGGTTVGEVTSGNFSPMLERAIALAFLPPALSVGDAVEVVVRGDAISGQVAGLPFVGR